MAFPEQPTGRHVHPHEGFAIKVVAEGQYPPPYTYQWRKDGVPLSDGAGRLGTHTDTLTLTLDAATWADGGKYDVIVGTFCGSEVSAVAPITISCPADTNGDGAIGVQDLFDYLALYFSHALLADITGDFDVSLQDLFEYLEAFLSRCN